MSGLGTLLFHLITGGKVPAFLGSSFAYLGGFSIVAPMLMNESGQQTVPNTEMLPYACAGVALSGLVYVVFSLLISVFGIRRIMKLFPPVVTGPIIIAIGLILAPSAITNCQTNWLLAFVTLGTVIACNIWGKGMIKILPILLGDGLATSMAGLLGGPSNTTYGENTGVLALTKIYDPRVIRIAAVFAMILSFSPKFDAIINSIPAGIIGGISFVLYGMISAIGVRNLVENQVDFTNSRNLIIAAVILVCALGFNSVGGLTFTVANVAINLSGLAIAAIAGILLNAVLPGNTYEFDDSTGTGEGASLRV